MSDPGVTAVRIRKGNTVFHVHGDNAGMEGVWLAKGQVHGIYDAPVKTTWKTGAFQTGSTQKSRKFLHRDMTLGFHIKETSNLYELNESLFRQMFEYQEDFWDDDPQPTTIEIETILSGVRKLDVLMYEQPDFESDLDPQMLQYGNLILKLRAGQPFWYEDDYISEFSDNATTSTGYVNVWNPTDQVMYQKFILTRGTWALPDPQWVGPKGARHPGGPKAERVVSPVFVSSVNGGATVDLDRQNLMFRDANDTNILAQMAGKFFNYAVPPYTDPQPLVVSYAGAPAGGAMVRMVQPRRWSRPWGLEHISDAELKSATIRSNNPGTFTFDIPDWADAIDVVVVGGGGGGDAGTYNPFGGGAPTNGGTSGQWDAETWVRGDTIPWETTVINLTIGHGGAGGTTSLFTGSTASQDGTQSAASAEGALGIVGPPGAGGANSTDLGQGSYPKTFNGHSYRGGQDMNYWGGNGTTPGGGGASGRSLQSGGRGANGAVWVRVYQAASPHLRPAAPVLKLTGFTPNPGPTVEPLPATLVLDGAAVLVRHGIGAQPAGRTLHLVGFAPANHIRVQPATRVLTLTGAQPGVFN